MSATDWNKSSTHFKIMLIFLPFRMLICRKSWTNLCLLTTLLGMGLTVKVVSAKLNKELNKQSLTQSKWLSNQDPDHRTATDQSLRTTWQTLILIYQTTPAVTTQLLNTIQRRCKQGKRELYLRITSRIRHRTSRQGSSTIKIATWKATWIINTGDMLLNQVH